MSDIHYEACDEDGLPPSKPSIGKWREPKGEFQNRVLSTCKCKHWPSHGAGSERSFFIAVEKAMMSLASGVVSEYPSEWVEHLITWAQGKNKGHVYAVITLSDLRSAIENEGRKQDFVSKWMRTHPMIKAQPEPPPDLQVGDEIKWDL